MTLALNLANPALNVIAAAAFLSAVLAWTVLGLAWRERFAIEHAVTTKLESTTIVIVLLVASATVVNTTLLSAVTVLTLFKSIHTTFTAAALTVGTLTDGAVLPVVLVVMRRGRRSLAARTVAIGAAAEAAPPAQGKE